MLGTLQSSCMRQKAWPHMILHACMHAPESILLTSFLLYSIYRICNHIFHIKKFSIWLSLSISFHRLHSLQFHEYSFTLQVQDSCMQLSSVRTKLPAEGNLDDGDPLMQFRWLDIETEWNLIVWHTKILF